VIGMRGIEIRRATPEDSNAIERLRIDAMRRNEIFPGPASLMASLRSGSNQPNSMVFLAEKEGKLVGLRSVHNLNTDSPYFRSLFVLESERHSGVGTALVRHVLGEVFSFGHVKKVSGKILEEDELRREKIRAHYESMGFTVEPSGEFRMSREAWAKASGKA